LHHAQNGASADAQHIAANYQQIRQSVLEVLPIDVERCSNSCQCAGYVSSTLQQLQSLRVQGLYSSTQGCYLRGAPITSQQAVVSRLQAELLPTLAAKLFDPAGKHKLVAVQEALREFHK
jgi:hypothetical protein